MPWEFVLSRTTSWDRVERSDASRCRLANDDVDKKHIFMPLWAGARSQRLRMENLRLPHEIVQPRVCEKQICEIHKHEAT